MLHKYDMQHYWLLGDAARLLGVQPHIITYLLTNRLVPEPARIGGRRCFDMDDLRRIAEKLGVEFDLKRGGSDAE